MSANEHTPTDEQSVRRETLFHLLEEWHPAKNDGELPPSSVSVEAALMADQWCPRFALVVFNEHEVAHIELYATLDISARAAIKWLERDFPSFPVGAVNLDTGEIHRFLLTAIPLPAEPQCT
jgi:hypothetical protein